MTDTSTRSGARSASGTVLQVTAVLSLVSLLFQFITAGQILSDHKMATQWHGDGAVAFHVVTGLAMLAAALHWRLRHITVWPAVVMAVAFVLGFVQARLGDNGVLWAHVPCALLLTVAVAWVMARSFRELDRARRDNRPNR